nr:MAG TPA: hypothetical protein [Bacteriophage sp.]
MGGLTSSGIFSYTNIYLRSCPHRGQCLTMMILYQRNQ